MFKARYPQLRDHQKLIEESGFLTPLHEDNEPRLAVLALGSTEWRNVSVIEKKAKHPRLSVRLFLNGNHVHFIKAPEKEYLQVCRLADLALLFFWKYRLRGGPAPRECLNFSLVQAQRDLDHEPVLRELLSDYEAELIKVGMLPNAAQLLQLQKSARLPKAASLRKQVENFPAAFANLEQRIDSLTSAFKQLVVIMTAINERLQNQ